MSEQTASNTMKLIVVVLGIFCTAMVFLVDKLGAIIQVSRHPAIRLLIPLKIMYAWCEIAQILFAQRFSCFTGVIAGGV